MSKCYYGLVLQWNADINYPPLGLNESVSLAQNIKKKDVKDAANSYLNIDDSLTATRLPQSKKQS